jgi:uncharacterized phage protein (TIGR02216 family)
MTFRQAQDRRFGEQAVVLAGMTARLLGWRPDEFWRATPAELAAVLQDAGIEQMACDELARLMEQYPDG